MENFKLTSQTNIEDIDILNIEDILKKQNINKQKKNIIIVGPRISYLPNQSNILSMLKKLGEPYAVKIGFLTDFCNSTSGWLLGNVPHRMPAGGTCEKNGLNSIDMIKNKPTLVRSEVVIFANEAVVAGLLVKNFSGG